MNLLSLNPFKGPEHQPFVLEGGPQAALLIHGFPGTPAEMRPLAVALHAQGWTAQALLLPGFGPELERLTEMSHTMWLDAIRSEAQTLRRAGRPFLLIGYSLGGALALAAAADVAPDALILLSPFTGFPGPIWALLPILRRLGLRFRPFHRLGGDFNDPGFRQGMENFLPGLDLDDPAVQAGVRDFALPWALLDELRRVGKAAKQTAPRLHIPLLVVQGREDPVVPPARTRKLLTVYGGPVVYHETPAGHDLIDPSSVAWGQIVAAIHDFLRQLSEGSTA